MRTVFVARDYDGDLALFTTEPELCDGYWRGEDDEEPFWIDRNLAPGLGDEECVEVEISIDINGLTPTLYLKLP